MQKQLSKLIDFIQTKEFVLLSLIFSLIPQLFHSVMAFIGLAPSEGLFLQSFVGISGFFFALGVSLSILVQTLRGNQRMAYVYLFIELLINLVYYETYSEQSWMLVIVQILFALIMPVTIASYAHLMEEEGYSQKEVENLKESIRGSEERILTHFKAETDKLNSEKVSLTSLKKYITSTEFQALNLDNNRQATIKLSPNEKRDEENS